MSQERDDAAGDEALSVLRGIWTAQRQTAADIESAPSSTKVCKNMKNIGFGGIAGEVAEGASTAGPVEEDLRGAWRDRLRREGKVAPGATTLRDLVLGDADDDAPRP